MILSNYYKMVAAIFMQTSEIKGKDLDGTETSLTTYSPKLIFSQFSYYNPSSVSVITFGTGNTPVTFDDYKLASNIGNSDIVASNFRTESDTYDAETGIATKTRSFILSNNRNSAITVREIGISFYRILLYREVLDEPFTIAAGETIKYTHTFRYTVPTTSDE